MIYWLIVAWLYLGGAGVVREYANHMIREGYDYDTVPDSWSLLFVTAIWPVLPLVVFARKAWRVFR